MQYYFRYIIAWKLIIKFICSKFDYFPYFEKSRFYKTRLYISILYFGKVIAYLTNEHNELRSHESRFDVFSAERFSSENNNGAGSPGITAAALERLGAALEPRL